MRSGPHLPPSGDPESGPGSAALFDLLHCLARALQGEVRQRAVERGLLPVHGQVLGFLRAANRYSNTLQVLAEYLGQTKGTVSQTVQLLERKGLVRRDVDARDRRVTRLSLTDAGRRLIAEIETDGAWTAALGALDAGETADATRVLTNLLRQWQGARGGATFGVCRSCAHFRIEGAAAFRCGLTGEVLSEFDSGQICREHRLPDPR
ncbi:MarR family winged helix-turn-helix transcriptional regulator [Aromatoleum petrolei]|uniref:MarR family transcriptional regulator n=1 Tax=Aromatoleum petrolei TaxID=76116 RepID=A0ABX1MUC9_9RHOO|nr:MarR family winged helix-turn-helix transcriptional regulator [Aromatoleum petrolei]NMF91594.1 MarR family transcriptional regulator [Aromatoleum petrolei]QTQ37045.1 Transcriptional regulator, MarR family [Aromatoleum petrolei]